MASSATRSPARGLPGFFFGFGAGSSGATHCQEALGTSSRAMPQKESTLNPSDQPNPYFR